MGSVESACYLHNEVMTVDHGSFNCCNLPPWVIASRQFNDSPQSLELQGVKQANRFLFDRLNSIASAEERAVIFNDYMSVKFQLHYWQEQTTDKAKKSIKNSYLRYPVSY